MTEGAGPSIGALAPQESRASHHHTLPAPQESRASRQHNLPAPLTSFVGRQDAVAEVKHLLGQCRMLTLVGAGGIGKTRLALHVASESANEYAHGARLVDLASVVDPVLLPVTVAAALGVREQPGRPMLGALADYLASRHLLLVLDNCEHLIAACAELCEPLLQIAPSLQILATSRQATGIPGETVFGVHSLSLPAPATVPDTDDAMQYEAIRLFVERARATVPNFRLSDSNVAAVAEICHQLDGMPLAIELAATRLQLLGPQQLAERLSDQFRLFTGGRRTAPGRHQTLRATLDWSHQLLAEPERVVLRRLAVFNGGWALAAAEQVISATDFQSHELLDLLGQLVEKSLVVVEDHGPNDVRFRMLETIRQYAWERLEEAGEVEPSRARHADWCVRLAEDNQPPGMHHPWHAEQLIREQANLSAALLWANEHGDAEAGLRIGAALAHVWYMGGHYTEGRVRLAQLLELSSPSCAPSVRASGLTSAGHLAYCQGDLMAAQGLLRESLSLWQALGNDERRAVSLHLLANVVRFRGDLAGARPLFEEAHAINHRLGHPMRAAMNLALTAQVLFEQGDLDGASALNEQSFAALQNAGPGWGTVLTLCMQGRLAATRGDYLTARRRLEMSLELGRELGVVQGVVWPLYFLAQHSLAQGDARRARLTFMESLRLARESGDQLATAHCLEGVVGALAATQPGRAMRLAGAAEALRELLGSVAFPADKERLDRWVGVAVRGLGERTAATARAEGRAMGWDKAIAYALAGDERNASGEAARRLAGQSFEGLTRREVEVLRLVALAQTNREIAAALVLSEKTVERHLSHIFTKLQVSSRAGATRIAVQAGIA